MHSANRHDRPPSPAWRRRAAWLVIPALMAGCIGNPAPHEVAPPPARQSFYQIERSVELRVDPTNGTINGQPIRQVLADALNVQVEATELTQADGRTSLVLLMRNPGGSLADLRMAVTADRPLVGSGAIGLGLLPSGGEVSQKLVFTNDAAAAFTVTLRFTGSLMPGDAAAAPASPAVPVPVALPSPAPEFTPEPTPTPEPTATPVSSGGGGSGGGGGRGGATPTPSPTPTSEATPEPTPTPTPSATATPSPSPTASPTPTPAPSALPTATPTQDPGLTPNPGPHAARGQLLLNGKPASGIKLQIIQKNYTAKFEVVSDAQGYFTQTGLADGDYFAYYYNDADRNKIGFWQSMPARVDGTQGAAFLPIDLYGVGQQNVPLPDGTRYTAPVTFQWIPQTQTVKNYRFRLHSDPGTQYRLVYQSSLIPGTTTSFSWDGQGAKEALQANHRYFWGVEWDAGEYGKGGNLYQGIYFNP